MSEGADLNHWICGNLQLPPVLLQYIIPLSLPHYFWPRQTNEQIARDSTRWHLNDRGTRWITRARGVAWMWGRPPRLAREWSDWELNLWIVWQRKGFRLELSKIHISSKWKNEWKVKEQTYVPHLLVTPFLKISPHNDSTEHIIDCMCYLWNHFGCHLHLTAIFFLLPIGMYTLHLNLYPRFYFLNFSDLASNLLVYGLMTRLV